MLMVDGFSGFEVIFWGGFFGIRWEMNDKINLENFNVVIVFYF